MASPRDARHQANDELPRRRNYALAPTLSAVVEARGPERMNARRSALIVSAWVVGIPWGNPWYVFRVPFGRSFADRGPESAYGTTWSSSLCITRTGTVIFLRSSVKSVWEKATTSS